MLNIKPAKGTVKIENRILNSDKLFRRGIIRGAKKAGSSVVSRSQRLLDTGERTGRKYPNLPHTSSAPGEYPRSQSGRLRNRLYYKAGNPNVLKVGATAKHALYLERGTRYMSARPTPSNPWLKEAIDQEHGITDKYLQDGPYQEIYK